MGGSSSGSSGSSTPTILPGMRPLIGQWTGQAGAASGAGGPILMQSFQPNPEQIAGLSPQEQALINEISGFGAGTSREQNLLAEMSGLGTGARTPYGTGTGDLSRSEGQIGNIVNQANYLTGKGPQDFEQAQWTNFNTNAVPQAMTAAGMSGAGRGGAVNETLTNARANLAAQMAPTVLQAHEAGAGLYGQAANDYSGLANQRLAMTAERERMADEALRSSQGYRQGQQQMAEQGLQAQDMPRQIQQEKFRAQFEDFLRRSQLAQHSTIDPLYSIMGRMFGENSSQRGSTDPGVFGDILGFGSMLSGFGF